jgi:tetratricopeptide (TPR) repeat protein
VRRILWLIVCLSVSMAQQEASAQYSSVIVSRGAWPSYGYGYNYSSSYGYGAPLIYGYGSPYVLEYPYGYGYGYTWPYYLDNGSGPLGPYVAPPLYVPPEQLGYGPAAVRRFMGLNQPRRPIVNNIIVAPPAANAQRANNGDVAGNAANRANDPIVPPVRASNAEARDRARRFVEFGDTLFEARNLAGAYERYTKAAEAAPDLAEPYFRQGHTLADMARYDQAAAAFRRGLALRPDWPQSGSQLSELYRDNLAARAAMLDRLKRAAEANPGNHTVQFIAGVQFFMDGQREAAKAYLDRAKAAGAPATSIEPFYRAMREDQAAELDI